MPCIGLAQTLGVETRTRTGLQLSVTAKLPRKLVLCNVQTFNLGGLKFNINLFASAVVSSVG